MLHTADAARTAAGWLTARVDQTRGRCGGRRPPRPHAREPCPSSRPPSGPAGSGGRRSTCWSRSAPPVGRGFAAQEAYLVDEVADLRVTDAGRFLRAWQQAARQYVGSIDPDEPLDDAAPRVAVKLAQTFDGRFVLDGEMDAEHGTIIRAAIDAEVDEMYRVGIFGPDDGLSPADRRGQALVQIVARKSRGG